MKRLTLFTMTCLATCATAHGMQQSPRTPMTPLTQLSASSSRSSLSTGDRRELCAQRVAAIEKLLEECGIDATLAAAIFQRVYTDDPRVLKKQIHDLKRIIKQIAEALEYKKQTATQAEAADYSVDYNTEQP